MIPSFFFHSTHGKIGDRLVQFTSSFVPCEISFPDDPQLMLPSIVIVIVTPPAEAFFDHPQAEIPTTDRDQPHHGSFFFPLLRSEKGLSELCMDVLHRLMRLLMTMVTMVGMMMGMMMMM